MRRKRQQPLFEGISSTEITPLSEAIRERLRSSESLREGGPMQDGGVLLSSVSLPPPPHIAERRPRTTKGPLPAAGPAAPSTSAQRSDDFEPLANLLAPPAPPPAPVKSSRSSTQVVIESIEKHPWWLGLVAFVTALSLAVNLVCALALRSVHSQLQIARSRVVSGSVITPLPSADGALSGASSCVSESSQTISGASRDQLLLDAIRQHEMGRRAEALSMFKSYVKEACDAATLQTVWILERELSPLKKERAR